MSSFPACSVNRNVFNILLLDGDDCEYMVLLFLRLALSNINTGQTPNMAKIASSHIKKEKGESYMNMTVVTASS